MNKKLTKLHLGCGEKYLDGYVNIDYPQEEHTVMGIKADLYKDIRLLKYPNKSVDEIRSHHMFEHFIRAEALALLLNWRDWLRVGGKLVIETPDFQKSALYYALSTSFKRRMELGRHIFGSEEADWAVHYDFWDKNKFKYILKKAGFENVRFKRFDNSFAKRYAKIPFGNLIGNLIPESLYRKHGGNKLPNITVMAIKGESVVGDDLFIDDVLRKYLVGKEGDAMLSVWKDQFIKIRKK